MTKNEYLSALQKNLGCMAYKDVNEIISDIEEHFALGLSEGKTESTLCEELGDPNELAKAYMEGSVSSISDVVRKHTTKNDKAEEKPDINGGRWFVVLFNLFIFVAPWIVTALIVIGIVMLTGFLGYAVALSCFTLINAAAADITTSSILLTISGGFFTVFGVAVSYFLVKYFSIGTSRYLKWNKKLWNEGF